MFTTNTPFFIFIIWYNKSINIFGYFNFMKKIFSKKYLLITVFALIFFAGTTLILLAATPEQPYYRVNKEKSNVGQTTSITTKLGTSTIINRSDSDFFVPNKTAPEYDAWSKKAPNYVEVSVCGDGVIYSKNIIFGQYIIILL